MGENRVYLSRCLSKALRARADVYKRQASWVLPSLFGTAAVLFTVFPASVPGSFAVGGVSPSPGIVSKSDIIGSCADSTPSIDVLSLIHILVITIGKTVGVVGDVGRVRRINDAVCVSCQARLYKNPAFSAVKTCFFDGFSIYNRRFSRLGFTVQVKHNTLQWSSSCLLYTSRCV